MTKAELADETVDELLMKKHSKLFVSTADRFSAAHVT
jgi:hypothetical protein